MSTNPKIPPPRSLNIYRLVVARKLKQCDVADAFGITPPRVCQVIRRVRRWVDDSIGDWLFPRRDDLRFYVALQAEQIRVQELEHDPHSVDFLAPDWSYSRHLGDDASTTNISANTAANISAEPINSPPPSLHNPLAPTSSGQTDYIPPHIHDLALQLAKFLTLSKNRAG